MPVVNSVLDRGFECRHGLYEVINAPEFFEDPEFVAYIEGAGAPVATWHVPGEQAGAYSDVVVFVDPDLSGDGSNSDMPEYIWETIIEALKRRYGPEADGIPGGFRNSQICVKLTNIRD